MPRESITLPGTVTLDLGATVMFKPDNASTPVEVRDPVGVTANRRVLVRFRPGGDAEVTAAL
jgi:hypothetical protein